jgi:hypothetical protein
MIDIRSRLVLLVLTLLLLIPVALPVSTADSGKRFKIVSRTFTQADGITIDPAPNSFGPVDPYPSSRTVSGLRKGRIKDVDLTLRQFSHQNPRDVDILLVKGKADPTSATVLSDIGGEEMPETNLTLTLDDEAANPLPADNSLDSGTFQPTNIDLSSDNFPSPAPPRDGNGLALFNGLDPNGEWRLFIIDDSADDTGSIDSWKLEITARVRKR